jgi:hypothetical protein
MIGAMLDLMWDSVRDSNLISQPFLPASGWSEGAAAHALE